jgi:small nuclear ribonucleoprotein (snRNP)-like protein
MVDAVVVGAFLGLVAVAGGALAWSGARDRLLRRRAKQQVVVTLKSGLAFRGVLFDVDDRSFVLRNAEALEQGQNGAHVPVDGEVFMARNDVEFWQRP